MMLAEATEYSDLKAFVLVIQLVLTATGDTH